MAWKTLGKDAPRKGDRPLDWLERDSGKKDFQWNIDPHFLTHLKSVALVKQKSVSQMLCYVMAVEAGYKPKEKEDEGGRGL